MRTHITTGMHWYTRASIHAHTCKIQIDPVYVVVQVDVGYIQLFTIIFIYKLTLSCYLQVTIL